MSEREWSKYQKAIFEHVAKRNSNLVIEALAGSGKSTVITELCNRINPRRRVCVSAFNTSTRDELKGRIRLPNVSVNTFHQIGFYAVRSNWGPVEIDKDRQRNLIRSIIPGGKQTPDGALGDLVKLVSMAMARLAQTDQDFEDIMDTYECAPRAFEDRGHYVDWAKRVLSASREKDGTVSFDDMIYLPVASNWSLKLYDDVLVDEAQDCNPAQLELLKRSVKPTTGRLIAVGDSHQAIYGFRGADSNTMDMLIADLTADKLPLSVCYRCPTAVVDLAKNIVPEFEAAPNAIEGEVSIVEEPQFIKGVRAGDLVVSRSNAALARCLMSFIRAGKRCFIMGKDLGIGINAFIDKIGGLTVIEFTELLTSYVEQEAKRLVAAKKEDQVEALFDKVEMIHALAEGLTTVGQLQARIRDLFGDSTTAKNAITLSSVHKAKGLEFDRVWMLESTFSINDVEGANLYYVAATRAKRHLFLVQTPNSKGVVPESIAGQWLEQQENNEGESDG